MRRVIAYTLIVLGLLIMLFPQANEYYENIQTQELLQSIANNGDSESIEFNDAAIDQRLLLEYQNTSKVLEDSINERGTNNDLSDGDVPQRQEKKTSVSGTDRSKAIAVIKIAKIKLNLPVLEGATKTNMKYAAAHLKETDPLGVQGNAAIAAHRAKTKGRLFNRLNEVEIGDEIVVEVGKQIYVYETDKVSIVKPTDVSVLKRGANDEAVLTLITCEPLVNPTHRLIVRAKLKES
ncbi:Sortase family protein [compost metagenome]